MNIFDWIVRQLDRTEVSFITFVAKIVPVIVPIIPAQIGYKNVTNTEYGLGWSPTLGWSYAIAIEGLGYAAIYIGMRFWEHNRKLRETDEKAPLFGVVVIYIIYICVTLFVNALLDYKANLEIYKVIATAMVSLLSVPAGLLMGISAIHTERTIAREQANAREEEERQAEREQRRNERERQRIERERLKNERPQPNTPNVPERTPKNRRPNERTNTRTPERTQQPNVLLPTNEQVETEGERPFGFQANAELSPNERIGMYIERVQNEQSRTPSQRETARGADVSSSTVNKYFRDRGL